jgi:S1-C subfamily serine protease
MVVEKELEDYVKAQKTLGVSDAAIRKSLLDAGYPEQEFHQLLAKHAHTQKTETALTTRHLLYLNVGVVIAFSLLLVYITYDYNTKLGLLSTQQEETAVNITSQLSTQTGALRNDLSSVESKLGSKIEQTSTRVEGVRDELTNTLSGYNYQSMNRDSALTEMIQKISNKSTSQLTSFQEQLKTFKEASVDFSKVIPKAVDAVVTIGKKGNGFFTTAGSGVLINNEGYIVTNYHVIDQLNPITIKTHDGNEYSATIVGKDDSWDIAVIKAVTDKKSFEYLPFADSGTAFVGQHVIAVGNPVGFESTVTEGIISNTDRLIAGDEKDIHFIQTDVAINAGNSGGPLIDNNGKILGIATLKYARSGFEGLSFALKSNDVQSVVMQILDKEGK